MALDEMYRSHQAIELALLRVRHRHEAAGDTTSTFGDLLHETRQELKEQYERGIQALNSMLANIRRIKFSRP
jgi:hypothetical protein